MEEDGVVKAPVTRLRRRLSVEQEDVSSPATPTKKRGGRLAVKPQLDLIDENAQVSSPRKTRRQSAVKDIADAEEKPVTPSRRSTRIKSNSSLILETLTAQVTDSPRARRALRRNSQAGSDNEGPATPARQRRTRKDSASSVENQDPAKEARLQLPAIVITEEPEQEVQVTVDTSESFARTDAEDLSPGARKSKRLSEKRNRRSGSYKSESDTAANSEGNKSLNSPTKKEKRKSTNSESSDKLNKSESDTAANSKGNKSLNSPTKKEKRKSTKSESSDILKKSESDTAENSEGNKSLNNTPTKIEKRKSTKSESSYILNKSSENDDLTEKLSQSNISLLKSVDTESKKLKSNHNKSTSAVNAEFFEKKKRNRTESWPTVTIPTPKDLIVFSDNESAKKKKKKGTNSISLTNTSIPDLNNSSSKVNSKNNKDTSIELKSKRKTSERSITTDPENVPEQPIQITKTNEDSLINTEKTSDKPEDDDIRREMPMLFEDTPSNVQAIVYFEDSDSNGGNSDAANKVKQSDSEDQCVPVVKHGIELDDQLSTSNSVSNNKDVVLPSRSINGVNDSCEPMDVDESLPEDVMRNTQTSLHDSNTEHSDLSQVTNIAEDTNKSKRKSSFSVQDTLDRSKNENKSTLVLSQIKDVSSTSDISIKKSPKKANPLMSKSLLTDTAADNSNNEIMKKNLSLNDLKGTPLRQKDLQKLTMQTSTPITAPTTNKTIDLVDKRKSDIINPDLSKSIDESSDENSDESDEPSNPKSKYLDDEAEEASDNYESGDSRDESERQYEDEHEIIERGETLGSDDDDSNDTDYEKDSFVVSSDAEDNELLSGTGEDLSMSDNELTMSKKSKKKFNERKLKEQKNASREMFESRHKLNTSESKSPAAKTKNNRMRIDSSLLDSDEEVVVKPKKGNRLRLESSTLDASMKQDDANASNKKANKSISNQSILNEKEITVCNDVVDAKDPLLVEVKTPQKDLNISVVQFTAAPEIENVELVESNSVLNKTDTDPLQETMANEDSDSSENEEILQNYDSVLDELNKSKKLKLDNNNISLNIGKKNKNNPASEPIVDQLNLTNSKKLKKAQNEASLDVVDSSKTKTSKKSSKKHFDSEDESSSIDLQLLFSEDNCGSGDENVDHNNQQNDGDEEKMFIPLKKSPGKTDIRESIDMNRSQQNISLNESLKKKKKRKSSGNFNESTVETEDANKSAMNESIKKKGRKSSITTETTEHLQDFNNAELNTSTKKKNRKSSVTESAYVMEDHPVSDLNMSQQHTKKKNRKSSITEQVEERHDNQTEVDAELNKSITKKDKRRSSLLVAEVEVQENINEVGSVLNDSGKKKKKRKSSLGSQEVPEPQNDLFFFDTTGAVITDKDDNLIENTASGELSSGNKKKNKKNKKAHGEISQSMMAENDDDSDGAPAEAFYRSEKAGDLDAETFITESQDAAETECNKKKRKKKKKKSAVLEQSGENANAEVVPLSNSKKRKRQSSDSQGNLSQGMNFDEIAKKTSTKAGFDQTVYTEGAQEITENATLNESLSTGSHNKKRKTSHNEQDRAEDNIPAGKKLSGKKKKNRDIPLSFQNITPNPETTQTTKKTKKRKERDEDTVSKKTKVSKDSSYQEVHLEPLPESILKQLVDGPSAKNKVVSTSKFIVENARQKRAKPSNYLEESVYLDDGSPLVKKEKPRMKKPKVLPFIPTASISDSGFTTNFKINKLSEVIQFVAEPTGKAFSREQYLHGQLKKDKMKRLPYDLYKKQIQKRLSKF